MRKNVTIAALVSAPAPKVCCSLSLNPHRSTWLVLPRKREQRQRNNAALPAWAADFVPRTAPKAPSPWKTTCPSLTTASVPPAVCVLRNVRPKHWSNKKETPSGLFFYAGWSSALRNFLTVENKKGNSVKIDSTQLTGQTR